MTKKLSFYKENYIVKELNESVKLTELGEKKHDY